MRGRGHTGLVAAGYLKLVVNCLALHMIQKKEQLDGNCSMRCPNTCIHAGNGVECTVVVVQGKARRRRIDQPFQAPVSLQGGKS